MKKKRKKKKRFRKVKKFMQAACLAAGLTVAGWGTSSAVKNAEAVAIAPTAHISGAINPNHNISNVYVVFTYYSLNSSGNFAEAIPISNSISEGSVFHFSKDLYGDIDFNNDVEYTILGVYDSDEKLVTVGFDQEWATNNAIGTTWGVPGGEIQGVFCGQSGPYGISESDIANALINGDTDKLESFVESYLSDGRWAINGDTSKLVKFSEGTYGGTAHATASPVPIPGAIFILGSGLIGIVIFRKREKE